MAANGYFKANSDDTIDVVCSEVEATKITVGLGGITSTNGSLVLSNGNLTLGAGDTALNGKVTVGGLTLSADQIDGTGNVIDVTSQSFIDLNGGDGVCSATIAAPAPGHVLVLYCSDANNNCTVTLTAGTFDGTNNIATFDAALETLVLVGLSATRYLIVLNNGSVGLSS